MTEERTIRVDSMSCLGCEQFIRRAVGRVDGVAAVTASWSPRP